MLKYTEIIKLIEKKGGEAIVILYDTYGQKFYNYCIRVWDCDEEAAWDIVYRTLETLVLKLDLYKFSTQEKFEGFLFTVLTNYIRKYFRLARVKNGVQFDVTDFNDESLPREIDEQISVEALNKYYELEQIEDPVIIHLRECLETLDGEDQDILLLRAQGYPYEEIELFLNIKDPNLKVKHLRAKNKLIRLMTEKQKLKI